MASRVIKCLMCSLDLGIIRDATLRVSTEHLCSKCVNEVVQDRLLKNGHNPFDIVDSLFNDIFNKGN